MSVVFLDSEYIIPPDLSNDGSKGVVFLFFSDLNPYNRLVNQITRHIQSMDPQVINNIERSLDLQLSIADWDKHGNVCFANDPDLRPDFRTTFQAIDLWDYYFALWHSSIYWNSVFGQQQKLPLPVVGHFWKMVKFGSDLKWTQALKVPIENPGIEFSETSHHLVESMTDRVQNLNEQTKTGRLFLNDHLYLDKVPIRTWEYHLAGMNPLKKWIEHHMHQEITGQQLNRFIQIILATNQVHRLQTNIDEFLTKTKPSIDWISP